MEIENFLKQLQADREKNAIELKIVNDKLAIQQKKAAHRQQELENILIAQDKERTAEQLKYVQQIKQNLEEKKLLEQELAKERMIGAIGAEQEKKFFQQVNKNVDSIIEYVTYLIPPAIASIVIVGTYHQNHKK